MIIIIIIIISSSIIIVIIISIENLQSQPKAELLQRRFTIFQYPPPPTPI